VGRPSLARTRRAPASIHNEYNQIVANIRFEWDEAKNLANQRKHGIRFEQAIEVFDDPLYVQVLERIENGEERW